LDVSAWRIGTGGSAFGALSVGTLDGAEAEPGTAGTPGKVTQYADAVAKWIPGDVVAFYLGAITLISGPPPVTHPSVWLWLGVAVATAVLIVTAGRKAGRPRNDILKRVAFGILAFFVWSAIIPQSGWAAFSWPAHHPQAMAVGAALAGLIFTAIAESVLPD
jgi:hypothetical protein